MIPYILGALVVILFSFRNVYFNKYEHIVHVICNILSLFSVFVLIANVPHVIVLKFIVLFCAAEVANFIHYFTNKGYKEYKARFQEHINEFDDSEQ
jgi:type III secretory pathway component EscU